MRSDDWLAVAWSRSFDHVLHDCVGPYQGAERIALFHRPLITLSVWFDTWLAPATSTGEPLPFWPLMHNVIVHVASASLLWLVLRRFVPGMVAVTATLWWVTLPGHVEAVSWMIGRVDTHGTFFVLLTLLLEMRRFERRATGRHRVPGLAAFVAAACTKELALVVPALVFLHAILRSGRLRVACRASAPYALMLAAILAMRFAVLGESIGGYAESVLAPTRAFEAFRALVPRDLPWALRIACIAVATGCVVGSVLRDGKRTVRLRLVTFGALAGLVCALPTAGAAGGDGSRDERYQYLPTAALSSVLAAGGPIAPLALFAGNVPRVLEERRTLRDVCARIREARDELRSKLRSSNDSVRLFPCSATIEGFRSFHVGVDRLGRLPFDDVDRLVFPERPLFPGIESQRTAAAFGNGTATYDGPRLDQRGLESLRDGGDASIRLAAPGCSRAAALRVTTFGCFGWLRSTIPVTNADGDGASASLRSLLLATPDGLHGSPTNVLQQLWPQVEIGADPRPRFTLEALGANGERLAASKSFGVLPLTRELGTMLRAKEPRLWIVLLVLLAAAVLLFVGRHERDTQIQTDVGERRREP
ncbi:MAG: glycosyltransferase family 39 protein [Planctomycetes bacterium]|nr:glycosyltransferase family 39 protein [Planctomycetota bacterium]